MDAGSYWPGYRWLMQLREIMTSGVVTAGRMPTCSPSPS